MADQSLIIKIGSQADTRGFTQAEAAIRHTEESAKEFVNTLKLGVGIDLGGKIVEGLSEIPNVLKEATMRGIEFNAAMQTAQIGIAGALRSVNSSLTFEDAKRQGSEALDTLRKKSNELGLDLETMVDTFKINIPTMFHAGITDANKMIDTIVLLNSVAAQKGITGFQAQRDIMDLLNGQANRTILGKELAANGVTEEALKQAEQTGTLYELLTTKLAAYGSAQAAAAGTEAAAVVRLNNVWTQLLGTLSKPLFDQLTQDLNDLSAELQQPEAIHALQNVGLEIKDLVHDGYELTEWAVKNADKMVFLAECVGGLGVAMSALKIADIVTGLISMSAKLGTAAGAWDAETASIKGNTIALADNAKAADAAALQGGGTAGAGGTARKVEGSAFADVESGVGGAAAGAAIARKGAGRAVVTASEVAEGEGITSGIVNALKSSRVLMALRGLVVMAAEWIPEVSVLTATGVGIYEGFTRGPASYGYGKSSSGKDIEEAQELDKRTAIYDYAQDIRGITSPQDKKDLEDRLNDYKKALTDDAKQLGWGNSAQKDFYAAEIQATEALLKHVQAISDADLLSAADQQERDKMLDAAHKQAMDQDAADRAQRQKNRDDNAKAQAARDNEQAWRSSDHQDDIAMEMDLQAAQRGEGSNAIDKRIGEHQQLQSQFPRIKDLSEDPAKVEAREKYNTTQEEKIARLQEGKQRVAEEIARINEEDQRAQIEGMQKQIELVEALGKKKIAALGDSGATEDQIAISRKQIDDETEKQKLAWEDKIGKLKLESLTDYQIRHTEYDADQISRNAKNKAKPPTATGNFAEERDESGAVSRYIPLAGKGQRLDLDVTKRPGYVDNTHSRLSDFVASQQIPINRAWVGMPGPAKGGHLAASQIASSSGSQDSSAASTDSLGKSISESNKRFIQSLDKATAAVVAAGDAAVRAVEALHKKITLVEARVERAARS